jgi:hypothetical protein
MFDKYVESKEWEVIFPIDNFGEPIISIYRYLKAVWTNQYDKWVLTNRIPIKERVREIFEFYKDEQIIFTFPIKIRSYTPFFYLAQIAFDEDEMVKKCFTLTRVSDTVIEIKRREIEESP